MQRTLVIIKPDAVQRGLIGRIISRLEEKGLKLVAAKLVKFSDDIVKKFYSHLTDKPFFQDLKRFMTSTPVLLTVWEGPEAVKVVRKLCGVTNSREAEPSSIRGSFSMSSMCNVVHSSGSPEEAEREISMFFSREEIIQWERKLEDLMLAEDERE
ncbi:MAG: nucleoside-diphosphate kinase [Candidatus Micrarchaeota archaeon]|nr:nucleoside-diphosphate kinase [Candidatus Micrarchaeota archaeon]